MAIIKCPDCGREVSDSAHACPQCGCPVFLKVQESKNKESTSESRKDPAKKYKTICMCSLLIFGIVLSVYIILLVSSKDAFHDYMVAIAPAIIYGTGIPAVIVAFVFSIIYSRKKNK